MNLTILRNAFALGIALVILSGCSSDQLIKSDIMSWSAERRRQNVESEQYIIQKGDQVELVIDGYPEFSGTDGVKETGTITIPLVGDVPAAGKTRAQLREVIIKRLSDYVKNRVDVTIKVRGTMEQKLIVLGSVTGQGSYPAATPVSPFQALALAGGPSQNADLRHIRLFRGGDVESTMELDLSASLANIPNRAETLPLVYPGDLLYVPREENVIRDFADLLRDVIVLFGIFAIVR